MKVPRTPPSNRRGPMAGCGRGGLETSQGMSTTVEPSGVDQQDVAFAVDARCRRGVGVSG